MSKIESVISAIVLIKKVHTSLFGWGSGSFPLHKSNYMIEQTFPEFALEDWEKKAKQLSNLIYFYGSLKKSVEYLYNLNIKIFPYSSPDEKEINFYTSEKTGNIYIKFNIQNIGDLPVLEQIDQIRKIATYEFKETYKKIKELKEEASKQDIESLEAINKIFIKKQRKEMKIDDNKSTLLK